MRARFRQNLPAFLCPATVQGARNVRPRGALIESSSRLYGALSRNYELHVPICGIGTKRNFYAELGTVGSIPGASTLLHGTANGHGLFPPREEFIAPRAKASK